MRAVTCAALVVGVLVVLPPSSAVAAVGEDTALFPPTSPSWHMAFDGHDPEPVAVHAAWLPAFIPPAVEPVPAAPFDLTATVQGAPPPTAYVYSDGYQFRLKVHKYASLATVPLFVAQAIVGQKLYSGDASGDLKDVHSALAATTGALFAINTVTGVWNLWDGWDNPAGRKKRLVHSLLMLAADAAFLATAGTAPESEEGESGGSRSAHRNAAIVGFSSASVGYVLMLLSR